MTGEGAGHTSKPATTMIAPGLYRMNFRGLTFAESWRFAGGPFVFLIALVLKAIRFKGARMWLPTHQAEERCTEAELSEGARTRLLPEVEKARALGYGDGRFIRAARIDDPAMKEGCAYIALHADRTRALMVAYTVNAPAGGVEKTAVCATGALSLADGGDVAFLNHRNYMDGEPTTRHVVLKGCSLADLDAAMAAEIAKLGMNAKSFSSWEEMKAYAEAADERAFEGRIRRGLFIPERE